MNTRIMGMLLLACCFISGCDDYTEGDSKAGASFDRMTVQEKILYKGVQDIWGQKNLLSIRQGVGSRPVKPSENDIPFIDIASVIKTNNDVTLKMEDTWDTSNKEKHSNSKWDKIDGSWYLKIINKYNSNNSSQSLESIQQPKEFIIKPEPKIVISKDETPEEIIAKNKKNGYVPEKDYDEIYYTIKNCPTAIEFYQKVVKERLLNSEDVEFLSQLKTECKAKAIGDRLKWTK